MDLFQKRRKPIYFLEAFVKTDNFSMYTHLTRKCSEVLLLYFDEILICYSLEQNKGHIRFLYVPIHTFIR